MGMKGAIFFTACLAGFLGVNPSFADPHFIPTRQDQTIPSNCRDVNIQRFASYRKTIIFGIQGAKKAGFTHEFPISRKEAALLWAALKSEDPSSSDAVSTVTSHPTLRSVYQDLLKHGVTMGFDFKKEGDILEALAIRQLEQEFPSKEFFITGGLQYGDAPPNRVLGELDIIIANRSNCSVVAIGESKLGTGERNHAVEQLQRFHGFLRRKLCLREKEQHSICSRQEFDRNTFAD